MSSDKYLTGKQTPNNDRIKELRLFFQDQYGIAPKFFVKVPGRVNLIGEHIDYCGFPVLPMAIEQSILLAVGSCNDNTLHLSNIDRKFEDFTTELDNFSMEIPSFGGPKWYNYYLCGVQGIFDNLPNHQPKCGMMVAVSGNIPPAAGLSSSSALVSAATLATAYEHNFPLNKHKLADIAAACERYIGTQGGGMDQAIAFLAEEGCAQFIEWNPLRATPIKLPNGAVFVIANSLSEANKAANSDFNQRVVECRLGCRIIAKKEGLNWREISTFATLKDNLDYSFDKMISLADDHLREIIYTRQDVIKALDISDDELNDLYLTENTKNMQEFKLRQRALHVFQESLRVQKFKGAAMNNNMTESATLMRESHHSLQHQYECSHSNLDRMIELSDDLGIGARLTGAGWGGCIVALCYSQAAAQAYIKELKSRYYEEFILGFDGGNYDNIIFATSPQNGAEIYLDNF